MDMEIWLIYRLRPFVIMCRPHCSSPIVHSVGLLRFWTSQDIVSYVKIHCRPYNYCGNMKPLLIDLAIGDHKLD